MGEKAFGAVPERLSKADWKAIYHAFHHSAKGVAFGRGSFKGIRPFFRLCDAANFLEGGAELRKMHHPFGNDARRNNAQGKPAAEVAAAAGVVEPAEAKVCGEVGVARAGVLPEALIVFRPGVLIAENNGERSARSAALVYS